MKRCLELVLMLLFLSAPTAAEADDALAQARRLSLAGRHAAAREAARVVLQQRPDDPEALQIVVAASCELGDEVMARLAFKRLSPDVQSMAARHCARRGIQLTGPAKQRRSRPPRRHPRREAQPAPPPEAQPAAPEARPAPLRAVQPPPGERPPDPRRPWQISFWVGMCATVGLMVGAGMSGARAALLGDELDDAILRYRTVTGSGDHFSGDDACSAQEIDLPEASEIRKICDDGDTSATIFRVLIGAGITAAALSGYFYYRGYVKQPEAPRVSLTPTLSPSAGGLTLRLNF